jgi:hypothetical protein
MLDPQGFAKVASTFAVAEEQVRRDHLIGHTCRQYQGLRALAMQNLRQQRGSDAPWLGHRIVEHGVQGRDHLRDSRSVTGLGRLDDARHRPPAQSFPAQGYRVAAAAVDPAAIRDHPDHLNGQHCRASDLGLGRRDPFGQLV